MKSMSVLSAAALCAGLISQNVSAQAWTSAYASTTAQGDCAALPAALNTGFTTTPIVSRALFPTEATVRILKMDFWMQPGAQYNDIYMIEKGTAGSARVLYYNAVANTLTTIGTLTGISHGGGGVAEQGLLGIAVNPVSFGTDNYLYLNYSVGTSATNAHSGDSATGTRVVRYTLNPTTKMIDMASAKVLLHIPMGQNGRWHTAGAMKFDNFGNLYVTTADNEALANGPGNTANLRGGILRIKPDNSARGYSIPAGNFGEYWAQKWQDSGLTARAAEYRDTNKVRPEIYIKGSRNPYSLSVDRHRLGWLAWGECGPDVQRGEEHNLTTKPAFSGWPFWAGNGTRQQAFAGSYNEPNEPSGTAWANFNVTGMSTSVPVNNWTGNTGVDTLPPMHQPSQAYTSPSCAVGGDPIIRYDGSVSNPKKMPPHLDNVMMTADFGVTNTNSIWAMKIDTLTGKTIGTPTQIFTMAKTGRPNTSNPVDFQHGRDGSLYMIDWGTGCCSENSSTTNNGIVRITYEGTCQDPALVPTNNSTSLAQTLHRGSVDWLRVGSNEIRISADGAHTVKILDLTGRMISSFNGSGSRQYAMPQALSAGTLYVLRVETNLGTAVRTFSRL